jgi:hypothetical protein
LAKKILRHEATKKPQGHKERLKRSFFSSCVRRGGCPLYGFVLSAFFAASLRYEYISQADNSQALN